MPLRFHIAPSAHFGPTSDPADAYVPHYVALRRRHLAKQRRAAMLCLVGTIGAALLCISVASSH